MTTEQPAADEQVRQRVTSDDASGDGQAQYGNEPEQEHQQDEPDEKVDQCRSEPRDGNDEHDSGAKDDEASLDTGP